MTRSGKRGAPLHFEISNPLATVNQIRETAQGLSLAITLSHRNRPPKQKLILGCMRHTYPRFHPWFPRKRWPSSRLSYFSVHHFDTQRITRRREKICIYRCKNIVLGSSYHGRNGLPSAASVIGVLSLQNPKADVTPITNRGPNDVYRPWTLRRP
tara:strand:+ start:3779 stop:4243 length:465 start_codon:yes stop_codon:yes gene_type:complete